VGGGRVQPVGMVSAEGESQVNDWPADKVERRAVASLVPYARNARTHSPAQVEQISASVKEWGWTVPVLVDEAGGLIAGHGRVLAAKKLGLADIPVMVARGWSDAQKRAYVLADNRLAENAGWDDALLIASTRKLGKTHQNVLVFLKGDPRKATEACGMVELDAELFAEAEALDESRAAGSFPICR